MGATPPGGAEASSAEGRSGFGVLAQTQHEFTCHLCSKAPPPFRRAVSCGSYRAALRSLIHSLKYDGMLPLAEGLGRRLAQTILLLEPEMCHEAATPSGDRAGQMSLDGLVPDEATSGAEGSIRRAEDVLMVVPVPAHSSNRRYKHAELIAEAAVKELRGLRPRWNVALAAGLLERQRVTESQAGLTPHQRRVNVRGAFRTPHPEGLRGARVLLVDDIYTTGATARACTKALLKAGAAAVWVATVSRAQFEHIARPSAAVFAEIVDRSKAIAPELPMSEDVAFWDRPVRSSGADGKLPVVH